MASSAEKEPSMRRSRRLAVATGALALLATASFTASAAGPLPLTPRAGCNAFTDVAEDAFFVGEPSAHNFDITGVSYRLSESTFSTVIRVPGLGQPVTRGTGDTWTSDFTVLGKAVQVKGSRFSVFPAVDAVWDRNNRSGNLNTVYINGVETRAVIPGAEFDLAKGFVTLSVDRQGFEKLIGGSVAELSKQLVTSYNRVGITAEYVDEAPAPAKFVLDATANTCFV